MRVAATLAIYVFDLVLQLDNLDYVRILIALPQSDDAIVEGNQDCSDRFVVREVDAGDASHLVTVENRVHVLDVQALVIVDDIRVQLLGVPLLGLVCCLKVIAFANIYNLSVVCIHSFRLC